MAAPGSAAPDCLHAFGNLLGKGAAVGIAKNQDAGARVPGGLQRPQRVFGVLLEAVEAMLGVIHDLPALGLAISDRVGDHPQVFIERCADHFLDLKIPRLAHNGKDRGL